MRLKTQLKLNWNAETQALPGLKRRRFALATLSYLSLMYRRKADLDCGDEAAHKQDMAMFDQWRDKTMATRKANEEKKNQQTPGGITMGPAK